MLVAGLLVGAGAFAIAGPGQFVLGVRRDVRGRRPRQHRLSPGRLRAAGAARSGRARRPRVLLPHLRRHARQRRRAGDAGLSLRRRGMARRVPLRRRARRRGRDRRVPDRRTAGAGQARRQEDATNRPKRRDDGWKLLLSAPILANLVFFVLLSMSGGGLYNYLVATLGALHGTPATVANTRADRAAGHERDRRAGRRPAHRLHRALRADHGDRPDVHRDRLRAGRAGRLPRADPDRADVDGRLLRRTDHAVARHDRARGDAARAPTAGCSAS